MQEFQKKKRMRKILYSPLTGIFLLFIFTIFLVGVWGVYTKSELSLKNLERERKELEKLTAREAILASSIDFLKTEQGIEDEIRSKFRAVKDGERVAVIIDNQNPLPVATSTQPSSFWYKIFHWPQ